MRRRAGLDDDRVAAAPRAEDADAQRRPRRGGARAERAERTEVQELVRSGWRIQEARRGSAARRTPAARAAADEPFQREIATPGRIPHFVAGSRRALS